MSLRYQKGFGIPELLIGITVGMIVVAAALSLLQVTLRASNDNIKMARVEQELRQAMQIISKDLRRAGWWDAAMDVAKVSVYAPLKLSNTSGTVTMTSIASGALATIGTKAEGGTLIYNYGGTVYRGTIGTYSSGSYSVALTGTWPSTVTQAEGISQGSWNILRPEAAITRTADCILMSYDNSSDGSFSANEFFGYRLQGTALQVRYSGATTDTCNSGGTWENLTDSNWVQVTNFNVDYLPATSTNSGLTFDIREYTITVTGQLASDTSISRTLRETIKVRNDRIL